MSCQLIIWLGSYTYFLTQKHERHYAHVCGWEKQADKLQAQFVPEFGRDHKIGVLI